MAGNTSVIDNINNITGNGSTNAHRNLDSNYQDFLRLLTTQLQHQDPTDPTDTNQLTQQIATLSQVEQQINTNTNLEKLITLFNTTQYNSVVSYIGKQVEADGNAGALENGQARFAYYLGAPAGEVKVTIKNRAGAVVYTGAGTLNTGRNEFVWDGKNNEGTVQPNGTYTMEVKAFDTGGQSINSKTYITGIVQSVDSLNGNVYLSFGDISVPVDKVISVRQAPQPQG
jgi:flagellar basal-body rod modification protein FlgD